MLATFEFAPTWAESPILETPEIDPTWTVAETARRVPGSADVLDIFGIDPRREAGLPLAEAARRVGADPAGLVEALEEAGRVCAVVAEVRRVIDDLPPAWR